MKNQSDNNAEPNTPWHEICGSYHHETANCWPCAEAQQAMSRLAAEFECYLSLLRARYQRSLAKFEAKSKKSLASAITWNAEEALADEFTYNEISELAAKLAALETPEAARDALLRVIDYEREAFINHFRVPSGSGWTSNGVAGVLLTAKQQMLRNDGEAYRTLLIIIDDFIKKEIA